MRSCVEHVEAEVGPKQIVAPFCAPAVRPARGRDCLLDYMKHEDLDVLHQPGQAFGAAHARRLEHAGLCLRHVRPIALLHAVQAMGSLVQMIGMEGKLGQVVGSSQLPTVS